MTHLLGASAEGPTPQAQVYGNFLDHVPSDSTDYDSTLLGLAGGQRVSLEGPA